MDKLVHFCMYAGLSGIIWLEFFINHKRKALDIRYAITGAVAAPVVFGGAIELLQEYITDHRQGDILDFMANSSGVFLSALIAWYIIRPLIIKK
jgi:VanZ family protein